MHTGVSMRRKEGYMTCCLPQVYLHTCDVKVVLLVYWIDSNIIYTSDDCCTRLAVFMHAAYSLCRPFWRMKILRPLPSGISSKKIIVVANHTSKVGAYHFLLFFFSICKSPIGKATACNNNANDITILYLLI